MGNAPSESHMGSSLICSKCHKVLSPCTSFDNYVRSNDYTEEVYVFNGGEYFRPVGRDNCYICNSCFHEEQRREEQIQREEQRRAEERKREEQRREEERKREEQRREEERKRAEQRAKEAEKQRKQEELNQRLEESHQKAREQIEDQLCHDISDKHHQCVLSSHLDEFEVNYESNSDELLEILSSKCSIPVPNLSLNQLTAEQLGSILSALDKLLFDEWISAPPSLSTLQHTQVFITELCVLSLEISMGHSLQRISNDVQSLVESISQSACNVPESFLLTQALCLNMMHFFPDHGSCDADAALIAKQWAEELSTEDLYLIEFLGTLTTSLQSTVGRASLFILKMEIQCLKCLLLKLAHLNGQEKHSESTEMLLRLVQTNQWTPTEAVSLLKVLSENYAEDASITKVLMLIHVYDISPEWTDDSGHTLTQALDLVGPERFQVDFQNTLRQKDENSLDSALAELETFRNVDNSVIKMLKAIITGVLRYSENVPRDEPFMKDSFKRENLHADDIQISLSQLCKAVFDIKGWWPTVQQMLRWCVLVLTEKNEALELVGGGGDPCVTAMYAATQVCMGNKLDIVLSSDIHSHEQTKEWSDFYEHLGISLNTNMKKTNSSQRGVYETDIVYGTMDDFVSDYLQYGLEVMETGNPALCREFIIEDRSLSASHDLELSRLKENNSLRFAAETLQSLMGHFHCEDMEVRHRFIKALFQVIHIILNKPTDTDSKIKTISQKITGKELPSNEAYILTILENLIKQFTGEKDSEKNIASLVAELCFERLFACAVQFQASKEQTKELFQMASNLVAQQLWSSTEALNLLAALTDHHHDEDCTSIMKILHQLETHQVSSEWTDEQSQSLLELLKSSETESLIHHLEKSFSVEKEKSIDCLFDEIRKMKNIDEQTLEKSYCIVKTVTNLIESGEIKNHTDVQQARNRSHSTDTVDLQEILAVLCNAAHKCNLKGKWWPRTTQMTSWCLLVLSDTGKLLEMGTGEGKSCVIAMFAALRALRGEKVDVVSSSSVLSQRDAAEWNNFYNYFGITVDTNTDKAEDTKRKKCYQMDVVYGTIEAFAADHLRQVFDMKDVRPDRKYQCIIIDEVDSLLLDQGVQLTYLSSPMVSMLHLNTLLAMIWGHVSQYGFLSTGQQTFVRGPPTSFFKAVFDSINTEETDDPTKKIDHPLDLLLIAEESKIVPEGFTEDISKSDKDDLLRKLKTITQDAMVDFFQEIENYIPYSFTLYTLDDNGLLCLRKECRYNNQDIPDLAFVVLEEGLCCPLYDSEEILIKPIEGFISGKIQYTPCSNDKTKDKISIPGFLRNLIENKLSVWVQNAFLALRLREGREYVIENESVCPVDFRSTGIVELSKKWGDGLQQFVEIKHQVKLSTISTVTNYISNISFFEKYNGKIYGTTGTLGSETDMLFLKKIYPHLTAGKMPTFNRKKLFEVKGTVMASAEEWKSEIRRVVMAQISPNLYSEGRAALVICETINKANEIHEMLKSIVPPQKIFLYIRSDKDSLSRIDKTLDPGDVIVATNLAGRGTDIKVSEKVNNNGGLFVILSFLSENTRVELQAFGRTARKGKPGSAQVIMTTDHLEESFRTVSSLDEAKKTRDRLAGERIKCIMNDVTEMKLREDLFSEYCETLQDIYKKNTGDEQRVVVAIMNEFWGIWLQTKSEEIDQLKRNELQKSLKTDLSLAIKQSQHHTSPCSSIYHHIKFGNIMLDEKKWKNSMRLFEKAMEQDENWAAIAFYNHAYCTIKNREENYLRRAINDLNSAQRSLTYLTEECIACLHFVKISSAVSANSKNQHVTSLEKQITTKCKMISYFDKNVNEAITKLNELEKNKRDAMAKKSPMRSLVSNIDEDLQVEADNLYRQGLKYVFSVEEEPRFPWGALLVFCLGVLQIIGGALLTAFTFGTFAQVGIGLITEGISDCISGIESMVTGEFSWASWAVEKAISIGLSLIGFGIGKLIAKGFKASKLLIKGFGKQLKSMPKFLSRQAKDGLSAVASKNMINTVTCTAKAMVEEVIMYGFGKAEEEILTVILNSIKTEVKNEIAEDVESNMEKEPLTALVDCIILSHLQDQPQLSNLLTEKKSKLLAIFEDLSRNALQPFYVNLGWQQKLNSSISEVINSAKANAGRKLGVILTVIQTIHIVSLGSVAVTAVCSLLDKFFSTLEEDLNKFKNERFSSEKVKRNELSSKETEMLNEFKQDLVKTITALLADALVEVFHQMFSSHVVSHVYQVSQVNGIIRQNVRTALKSDRTEEKLRAGQNNRYIAYMPLDLKSKNELAGESGKRSELYAKKIMEPMTSGTILDMRVLSETTGTKLVILTEDGNRQLTKMQELTPTSKPVSQTVTLIYSPKSSQYPNGHYDVLINNQRVSTKNEDKSCLFHALARGMKPEASEEEITLQAARLRSMEADTLLKHPDQWEPFVKRKEWTDTIRGGDWFMAEGAAARKYMKENKDVLMNEVGKVEKYKDWKKYTNKLDESLGRIINADHQPPVSSLLKAGKLNQNSKLAQAMLEVATNSCPLDINLIPKVDKCHGPELPVVCVPKEIHDEFLSTKSKPFRDLVADAISQDDVVGTFKLTILGAIPRFRFKSDETTKNFNNLKDNPEGPMSKTRIDVFDQSFQEHSTKMVQTWFNQLSGKGVMTDADLSTIIAWLNTKGYEDQNDPLRNQVSNLLHTTTKRRLLTPDNMVG